MALKANRVGVRTDQVDAYGRVISSSFLQSILDHLPRWTSLKVWKNGTEQLLPVNTDEPATSPIVADIQYPTDSSATEQMFTYRKSPTEVDGEAYIQSIKGNTIVWNQLINNGNFASDSGWNKSANATLSIANNVATVTAEEATTYAALSLSSANRINAIANHKYLVIVEGMSYNGRIGLLPTGTASGASKAYTGITTKQTLSAIFNAESTAEWSMSIRFALETSGETLGGTISNYNCFDLTAMFGSTKADEIYAMETAQAGSGVAYFRSLFPLPYYKYDAGSLLSFNGTGIKTIGKNQLALPVVPYNTLYNLPLSGYFPILKGTYTLSYIANASHRYIIKLVDANGNYLKDNVYKPNSNVYWSDTYQGWFLGADRTAGSWTFSVNIVEDCYIRIGRGYTNPDTITFTDVQLELGSTATTYEPYTTSTTTIPTDTYFPTGMKSVSTAYDEFTSSRAYTRIGELDLGSVDWSYDSTNSKFYFTLSDLKTGYRSDSGVPVKCAKYISAPHPASSNVTNGMIGTGSSGGASSRVVIIMDTNYDDATDFKTAMDGVMLQYELAEEIVEPTLDFGE